MRPALIAGAVAVVAVALFAPAAAAHVQVLPGRAAPGDPTLFNVLVPNEADASTVRVELKIPAGVIPFSFQETTGWERSETRAANGSLDVVTWDGDLPAGEFVVFSFLATTPDQEGEVSWPAIQTYGDGTKVRWIGPADSDKPAPTTLVSSDVAPQNAGGEGAAAETADTSRAGRGACAGEHRRGGVDRRPLHRRARAGRSRARRSARGRRCRPAAARGSLTRQAGRAVTGRARPANL